MEFRSTNPDGFVHYGGDVVAGVNATAGIQLTSNSVQPCGDAAAIDLNLKAKGTGQVFIGGSTTAFKIVAGVSSYTPPALSSFATGESTITVTGLSTGDLIIAFDFRGQPGGSTKLAFSAVWPTPSASSEATMQFMNPHNSTASGSSGRVRWAYIKRT